MYIFECIFMIPIFYKTIVKSTIRETYFTHDQAKHKLIDNQFDLLR